MKRNRTQFGALTKLIWTALLSGLLLLVLKAAAVPNTTAERISRKDLEPLKGGMLGEQGFKREIVLAPGVKMAATIEVSTKGNGSLRIGNLNLRAVDSHDDGSYYENEMLDIDFTDLDGDGKREMVISGIVCFTSEKGSTVLRREAIVFIYKLQADRTFKKVYWNTDFHIEID